ncbi:MAG: hypothetical protein IPG31_00020 [Nitrosomonas sp.]|nr:hypothetical protein [Nitrosomonas sp.]
MDGRAQLYYFVEPDKTQLLAAFRNTSRAVFLVMVDLPRMAARPLSGSQHLGNTRA